MTRPRLWHVNADFELEIESADYRRTPTIAARNRRLVGGVLWLASPGDAILLDRPWDDESTRAADSLGVTLVDPDDPGDQSGRDFNPWGWSRQAAEVGRRSGARVDHPPLDDVARVNSKLFSHALERELGVAVPGCAVARTADDLDAAARAACPGPQDKWVIKSPFGFTARGRVLGRGPALDPASATWAARRFARGDALLVEPWLEVSREYGVQLCVARDGAARILGVTDIQTNGAGAVTGFLLGRPPTPGRRAELEAVAAAVGARLAAEGYWGPANVDALEHAGGLRPLLEINARHTLGLVALAVERATRPTGPTLWRLVEGAFPPAAHRPDPT